MSLQFTIQNAPDEHLDTTTRSYKYELMDFIDVDVNSGELPQAFIDINQNRTLCGAPELTISEFAAIASELQEIRQEYLEGVEAWANMLSGFRERSIEVISRAGDKARDLDERRAFAVHYLEFSDQNANGYVHLSLTKRREDDIETILKNTEYRNGRPVEGVQEVPEHTQVDSEVSEAGQYSTSHQEGHGGL